jgi:hypothetical protein
MATKPIVQDHNATTGEIITREMTDAEFAQYQKDIEAGEKRVLDQQKAAAVKLAAQAKLEALGLTVDDLAALGL